MFDSLARALGCFKIDSNSLLRKLKWKRACSSESLYEFRKKNASKNRIYDFQKTGILNIRDFSKVCSRRQATFALKSLLASFTDPFVERLLATGKIAVFFELQTKNLSKVSETFCSKICRFQKNGFEKYTFRKKKATENGIG